MRPGGDIASLEAHSYAREDLEELADLRRTVDKAIKDLHFVMAVVTRARCAPSVHDG